MYSYSIELENTSVSGAITLVQYKAGANNVACLLRAWCSQSSSTTSAQVAIEILRKSTAATVTSFTPRPMRTLDPAAGGAGSTSGTGTNASAEGTDSTVLYHDDFNVLTGWLYVPVPEERVWIPPSGIIALKFPIAPSATTFNAGIVIGEEQG